MWGNEATRFYKNVIITNCNKQYEMTIQHKTCIFLDKIMESVKKNTFALTNA